MVDVPVSGRPEGTFGLGEALGRAWERVGGSKAQMIMWSLLLVGVMVALSFVGLFESETPTFFEDVLMAVIFSVFAVGGVTLGLVRAAGERMGFKKFFRYMDRVPRVLLVMIPWYFLTGWAEMTWPRGLYIGLTLATVPATFWIYHVVDRDMGVVEAMVASFTLVGRNIGAVLGFVGLSFAVTLPFLALLVLGWTIWFPAALWLAGISGVVAAVWLMPYYTIVLATMFERAEGLQGDYSG